MPLLVQSGGQWIRDLSPIRSIANNTAFIVIARGSRANSLASNAGTNLSDPQDTFGVLSPETTSPPGMG